MRGVSGVEEGEKEEGDEEDHPWVYGARMMLYRKDVRTKARIVRLL